ncbi:MAG TPA: hypothetical protein VMU31_09740 [Rhizomicrobium sp.]|nr:hypothetical protein [Rhizomicrobium sp.]
MMPMMPISMSTFIFMTMAEALFAIPAGLVLKRTGHSPWWALLCFIPVAALLGLWVMAFTSWTPARPLTE